MRTRSDSEPIIGDIEARNILWMAICDAATKLTGKCGIYLSRRPERESRVEAHIPMPDVKTWQLLEGLNILAILLKSENVIEENVCNIFGKAGPIHFMEDGNNRYLWAQPTLSGYDTALSGRPDIVISSTPDVPSAATTLRVVESKCCKHVGAPQIRGEFGKAHDLRVTSYLIWSYYSPSQKVIDGARKLGLDLVALGFDTILGKEFKQNPENLVAHIANTLEMSKREQKFVKILSESSKDATIKTFGDN